METEYKQHMLEWTDEKVSKFWNFYNNYPPFDGTWFTEAVGDALLRLVNQKIKLQGKVLDYGTGKGFLVQYLLDSYPSVEAYACDFTDTIAIQTGEKFNNNKKFKGCEHIVDLPSVYKNNFFDFVFLVETIEHLTAHYLHSTLAEIHRILKPGGLIIITTPNNEILEQHFVHCADCGATFHHMQHVRSWNENSMRQINEKFGFSTQVCKGINLQSYKQRGFIHAGLNLLKTIARKKYTPNLIYIGKK